MSARVIVCEEAEGEKEDERNKGRGRKIEWYKKKTQIYREFILIIFLSPRSINLVTFYLAFILLAFLSL